MMQYIYDIVTDISYTAACIEYHQLQDSTNSPVTFSELMIEKTIIRSSRITRMARSKRKTRETRTKRSERM